ncbi:MAG: hypothetical protein ACREBH_01780 [Candidatus Micrarchaeaceae archaeon]
MATKPAMPKHHGFAPAMLDLVRIDGRWAQIVTTVDTDKYCSPTAVYLDKNRSLVGLDKDEYRLSRVYDMDLGHIKGISMTPGEFANVHWGDNEKEYPRLKLMVRVFGDFESTSGKPNLTNIIRRITRQR